MVNIDFAQLGIEVGGSGAIGFLIGFAAKKVAKVIAVLVGIQLVVFKFLESRGIITVDWSRLTAGIVKASKTGQAKSQDLLMTIISTAGVGAGFAGGFFLGFKKA